MVYYRKRTYRRRRNPMSRKRSWRTRWKNRGRQYTRRNQNIHQFTKYVGLGTIQGLNGTNSTFHALSFKISDIPGWSSDFQNSYDQFRIKAVKINLIPVSNVTSFDTTLDADARSTFYNRIFTVFDPNDATTPTSANSLREYQTCKWSPNNRIHKRFIYPKVNTTVSEGGGSYGLMQGKGSPWISMGSNQTTYYGLKVAVVHPPLNADHDLYVIECKYYIQLKNYL